MFTLNAGVFDEYISLNTFFRNIRLYLLILRCTNPRNFVLVYSLISPKLTYKAKFAFLNSCNTIVLRLERSARSVLHPDQCDHLLQEFCNVSALVRFQNKIPHMPHIMRPLDQYDQYNGNPVRLIVRGCTSR